jgi:hypothetical protein
VYFGATAGSVDSGDAGSIAGANWFTYTNITSESSDTKDSGYSALLGYEFEFSDFGLGIEAALVDLGEIQAQAEGQDASVAGGGRRTAKAQASADGFTLSALLLKPISDDFKFYGKLGVMSWDISAELVGDIFDSMGNKSGSIVQSASDSGTDALVGFGVEYKFIRAGIDRYKIDSSDTDYIYLGVKF